MRTKELQTNRIRTISSVLQAALKEKGISIKVPDALDVTAEVLGLFDCGGGGCKKGCKSACIDGCKDSSKE